MDLLPQLTQFLVESIIVLVIVLLAIAGIIALSSKGKDKSSSGGKFKITPLNKRYHEREEKLRRQLNKKAAKTWLKQKSKHDKENKQCNKPILFVLDFQGDIKASAVTQLSELINTLLLISKDTPCEVLLRVDSAGGMVHQYGFAAAQCERLSKAGIKLTISVDRIAASGGYMMACVADQILAAPFAIIGSIGVVFQMPNIHRYLDKHAIDVELLTAGDDKRNLTMLGKNTKDDRAKCQEQIDETHDLFKAHVTQHRSQCDINRVATGRYWYGSHAFNLQLIDRLITSDEYLMGKYDTHQLYHLSFLEKKAWKQRLLSQGSQLLAHIQQLISTNPNSAM